MSKPLVVFDLDDTIYPEREFIAGGLNAIAALLDPEQRPDFSREAWRLFDQDGLRGVRNIVTAAAAYCGLPEERIDLLEAAYRNHNPDLRARPGMVELLGSLRKRSWLGLLSDGRHTEQRRKWAALGLQHLFDNVIFTDEYGRDAWKPSQVCFLKLQSERNSPQARCIYIADNPVKDFIAPRILGWKSVRLVMNDQIHRYELDASADYSVNSVEELANLLDNILRL